MYIRDAYWRRRITRPSRQRHARYLVHERIELLYRTVDLDLEVPHLTLAIGADALAQITERDGLREMGHGTHLAVNSVMPPRRIACEEQQMTYLVSHRHAHPIDLGTEIRTKEGTGE